MVDVPNGGHGLGTSDGRSRPACREVLRVITRSLQRRSDEINTRVYIFHALNHVVCLPAVLGACNIEETIAAPSIWA